LRQAGAQLVSSLPAPWLALIGRCWTHSLGASVELRLSKIAHFSWPMRSKTIFGERSLRRALSEYVEHFHAERNHQGRSSILRVGNRSLTRGLTGSRSSTYTAPRAAGSGSSNCHSRGFRCTTPALC